MRGFLLNRLVYHKLSQGPGLYKPRLRLHESNLHQKWRLLFHLVLYEALHWSSTKDIGSTYSYQLKHTGIVGGKLSRWHHIVWSQNTSHCMISKYHTQHDLKIPHTPWSQDNDSKLLGSPYVTTHEAARITLCHHAWSC